MAHGPAWIDTIGADGSITHTENPAGGKWMSRQQARALAEANGWEYEEDDPDDQGADDDPASGIDVRALNRRLRKLGIPKENLHVLGGDSLALQGLWLDRLPRIDPPQVVQGFTVRTAVISTTPAELGEALDLLAPGWRDK